MLYHFAILSLCLPLMLASDMIAFEALKSSSKLFSSSVYKQVAGIESGNFLFSPLSVETVMALVQSGANGATGEEIRTALHLPKSQAVIEAAFKTLTESLNKKGVYVLNTANKIYLENRFYFNYDFYTTAEDVFGSETELVDFSQTQQIADSINQWVEGRTENKIKDLVSPNDFDSDTRVVLVNALHFKGNWSKQFSPAGNVDFYVDGDKPVKVLGIEGKNLNPYYESSELNAKFLEVPFEGKDVTFTIVLPNEKNGLASLESRIDEVLQTPNYTTDHIHIVLPKFKSETEVDFKKVLQKLGVKTVFSPDANLTRVFHGEHGDVYVDKVLQKSFIDVNEKGVEAAAATKVAVDVLSPVQEFNVDHPFIYYIKFKDVVVFVGRVVDPTK